MSWMVGNFLGAKRFTDAAAVLKWHPSFNSSAVFQAQYGDALFALNDVDGARAAWATSLRLEPGRTGIQEKLQALPAGTSERGR